MSIARVRVAAIPLVLVGVFAPAEEPTQPTLDPIRALLESGRYVEAEQRARSVLDEAQARLGRDSLEVARVLDVLVEALWRSGRGTTPEPRELAERAIAIKTSLLGSEDVEVARSLGHLAIVDRLSGRYAEARMLYERALGILEKALGPEDPRVATALNNLGLVLQSAGDYSEARRTFERAMSIRAKSTGPESREFAQSLNNLASVLWRLGSYDEARQLYERAVVLRERLLPAGHPEIATTLGNLANVLRDTGDYAEAKRLYEGALATLRNGPAVNPLRVASMQSNLALLLADMGDYTTSMDLYRQALAVQEAILDAGHPDLAVTLENLGSVCHRAGDLTQARALCERSLAIREAALPPGHRDTAWSLNSLAMVLADLGKASEARPMYERALAIWEQALGPDHPTVAECLVNYGVLLQEAGDAAGAKEAIERALSIREKALGPSHPLVAATLQLLAGLHVRRDESDRALEAALRAEAIGRDHLRLTCRFLPERQALRYVSVRASGLDLALSLAKNNERVVWDALIRSRALVLDELAARHGAATVASDPETEKRRNALVLSRARLANLKVRGPDPNDVSGYRKLLEEAQTEDERAEAALAETSAAFRKEQAGAQLGYTEVVAALPGPAALVAYAVRHSQNQPSDYVAFVLPRSGASPLVLDLGAAETIDALVAEWYRQASSVPRMARSAAAEDLAKYREVGARLRQRVWDPVAQNIGDAPEVFLVADGSLHWVNLSSLPTGPGGFLVETGPLVHYLSTERDLVGEETKRPRVGSGLLALGGPAFEAAPASSASRQDAVRLSAATASAHPYRGPRSACEAFRSVRFAPLPAAAREVSDIASLWSAGPSATIRLEQAADILTGEAATEARFKEHARGREVLHLATHGFFLGAACGSTPVPSRRRDSFFAQGHEPIPPTGENPLLLSGLALAGANHRAAAGAEEEDGILTAEEIAALDLSGVRWAVLSGCDTGLGELRSGEGVFGLRRAFRIAGVETVIMSLWAVEDDAARVWMTSLYEARLQEHADAAKAVREATLRVLRERRQKKKSTHPFYWAAFVAVGGVSGHPR